MSDQMQPLTEGEHVDLDTGTTVQRANDKPNFFRVREHRQGSSVTLEDEEIRQIAELAGYTVTDEPRDR